MSDTPPTMRQLRSLVTQDGRLEVSIAVVDTPRPGPHEVLVRVEAAPLNPSDIGLLLASTDPAQITSTRSMDQPVVTAPVGPDALAALARRVDESLPVGNEGAGVVVATGDSPEAQTLLGRTVSLFGGSTYAEYCLASTWTVLPLPDGITARQGASSFVNPLTALGMVETMRREGRTALVHTAAASNLGQMLNRICLADGIGLVNIVRSTAQADLLLGQGATHVCDSTSPTFESNLTAALRATGATLAFDAIGGGPLVGQILACMEAAIVDADAPYSRYGSDVHKQVYIYGGLDRQPTEMRRGFGFAWSVSGWLLSPFIATLDGDDLQRLADRIGAEITTTFTSRYTDEISLDQTLEVEVVRRYAQQATGQKFLITPQR